MGYTASPGAVISVSVEGVAASQRQIDNMARSMTSLTSTVQNAMRSLAATAGIGGGVAEVVQLSDEYTKLTSQLKLATDGARGYAVAYADVKRISAETQSALAGTGVLYARIANGTRDLGISQQKVADITEAVNLSLKVSGATSEEAASAQLQLSQAFAAGALRGEEFNAVNEAAPRLMRALADGLGVPVGALKQMASDGKITADVMAELLPKSLEQLRQEATQVQTIGGAFNVLKNNVLEFTATNAQANGSVAVLTGGIKLLSDNLSIVTGVAATLTAAKLGTWLTDTAQRTIATATANRTLAATNLANAEAQATATASASLLANARVAELRAATLAATGAAQLAVATNGLVPAQARAAAAAEAHAGAMLSLAVAQRTASTALSAGSAIMTALGGPVGTVITLLGVAATAWSWYGSKAEEANRKAADSAEASTPEILASLEKQNEKLRERLVLSKQLGQQEIAKGGGPEAERLASLLKQINDLKAKGQALDAADQVQLVNLQGLYDALAKEIGTRNQLKAELDASGSALTDVVAVRERLTGVNKQYLDDLAKLQTAREKGAISEQEYIGLVSQLATETWKSSEAGKAATASAGKQQTAYESLINAIREKLAESATEMNGFNKLAESQKLTIKLNDDIAAGLIKRNSVQARTAAAMIAQVKANENVIASQKRAADGAEATAKLYQDLADARAKAIDDAQREADSNERLVATFGMSKAAIEAQELARLREQLAQRASTGMTFDEIDALEKLIAAKQRSAEALASLESKEAWQRSVEQMVADAKRGAEQIEQALTDSIMRGGKSGAEYLQDLFRTLVLRPTIQAIMSPVSTALAATLSPSTGAAALGGSNLVGAAQSASSLYSMATGGLFNAGGSAIASLGGLAGSSSLSAFGAGFAGNAAGTTMSAAEMFSSAGMATEASAASFGAAVSAALPWIGGVVAAAALWDKAFGHGPAEVQSQGIKGWIDGSGAGGISYQNIHESGGWFRGDSNWVAGQNLTSDMTNTLAQSFQTLRTTAHQAAESLGLSTAAIDTYQTTFDIALTNDAAANQKALTDYFIGLGNAMAGTLPELAAFQKYGEGMNDTLTRLEGEFQTTDQVAQLLGKTTTDVFGQVGLASAGARERLLDLAGGASTLTRQVSGYSQNFLSEAERLAPVQAALNASLGGMGLSALDSREKFKDYIDQLVASGAILTEEGAKRFDDLMALEEAFAQVHPATEAYARSLADIASEHKSLQDQYDELTMTSAQLRAKERAGIDATNLSLYDAVNALKDAKAATDALAQAQRDQATSLLGSADGALSVLQAVVGREQDALKAKIDAENAVVDKLRSLSSALSGTLDGMHAAGQEAASRASAQAQIHTALAIAKAGGPLPDVASLQRALGIASQSDPGQFASYQDYLRDYYRTRNDIAQLGKLTDSQLSTEEQSLAALQAESKRLDAIVSTAQQQLAEAKGQSTTLLSIDQALQGFGTALAAALNNPVVAATQAVNTAYQSALGRAPDAAGLEFWQTKAAAGVPVSSIVDAITNSPEAKVQALYHSLLGRPADAGGLQFWLQQGASIDAIGDAIKGSTEYADYHKLHPFAIGTNYVPETMPALLHKGERVIQAGDNRELMRRLASPAQNGDVLVAAIGRLTDKVARLQGALDSIAADTREHKDMFDKLTAGGNVMLTEAA